MPDPEFELKLSLLLALFELGDVGGFSLKYALGSDDEVMVFMILHVSKGVVWIYGWIFLWAVVMEDDTKGGHVEASAIATVTQSGNYKVVEELPMRSSIIDKNGGWGLSKEL